MKRNAVLFFVAILLGYQGQAHGAAVPAESAGQILGRLNKLPAEQRQKILLERAKAEGEVAFYSSLQAVDADAYVKAFTKRYPFIKVNIYRIPQKLAGDFCSEY